MRYTDNREYAVRRKSHETMVEGIDMWIYTRHLNAQVCVGVDCVYIRMSDLGPILVVQQIDDAH